MVTYRGTIIHIYSNILSGFMLFTDILPFFPSHSLSMLLLVIVNIGTFYSRVIKFQIKLNLTIYNFTYK